MRNPRRVPDAMNAPGEGGALAALRKRAGGDPSLLSAVTEAERAYETLALERAALQSRLLASSTNADRELAKLRTLGRVAETVNSSLELDVVLRSVLDTAVEVMKAERGFLMIANAEGALELTTTYGIDRATVEGDDMRPSQTTVRRVFETGEPVVTTDAQQDPRFNVNLSVRALRLRSIICVPLAIKARTIGVVYLDSRVAPGLFSPHDPDLLTAFANQAALAIENARLFDAERARVVEITRLEQLQARVLGSITSGVITVDGNDAISTFNDAAAETFGVAGATMIGKPARALEALLPGITTMLRDNLLPTKPAEIDAHHPTRGTLHLEVRTAPIELPEGTETHGWAIAVTDLTERRKLERLHAADVEQRRAIRDAFARYLAPHVVEQLMRAPGGVALGGERATATILFADIVGFTELAERLEAEAVVEILNAFFSAAVQIIFEHDGLLDKFYGDGLMVVFGPPRVRDDDAARALAVARDLHLAARTIQANGAPLQLAIGVATGEVVAGHIGSPKRMDYTVIGDAANLASRLQGACPPSKTYIDEPTYTRLSDRPDSEKLIAKIRGKAEPVTIYAIP
ncbi:MAG TPA: adenylate/guanylate cyclase domain-containing protein [Candidatus Elarobacter sp.]|nr:adenylate/guanylate cyclase domain-containing protein [Candidatus Elarobacter sp.]